jgi:hypothetical protein
VEAREFKDGKKYIEYVLEFLLTIIVCRNREMKEELKNLREWVDRYDFADLRIAKTNQLKSSK